MKFGKIHHTMGICAMGICAMGFCAMGVCAVGFCAMVICAMGMCAVEICALGVNMYVVQNTPFETDLLNAKFMLKFHNHGVSFCLTQGGK